LRKLLSYHCLNRSLLSVLGRLSGDLDLQQCAERWNPANLSRRERAEIYVGFLATKNGAASPSDMGAEDRVCTGRAAITVNGSRAQQGLTSLGGAAQKLYSLA
jgi:hypothetical protein